MKAILIFLTLLVFAIRPMIGQSKDSTRTHSIIALPYGNYTEETSWAAGVAANYYLWNKNKLNKVSSFSFNGTYTLNNQIVLGLYNRYYFGENYYLYGRALFEKYPDYYFGMGNNASENNKELYTPMRYHINLEPQKYINKTTLIGLSLQTRHETITKYDEGQLQHQIIPGSENYYAHGLGVIYAIDTRDNNYYPSKGIYFKAAINQFFPVLKSSYQFTDMKFDYRLFHSVKEGFIFANQVIVQYQMGTAPFQMTPTFGGLDQMRGYRNGQYRDKLLILEQAEFRFPLYKRFLGAVFASAGNVWNSADKISLNGIKFSVGAGLRFRINDAKINLRGDGALTRTGKPAYYITSVEAF